MRQARHVVTDHTITLDDLIVRRRYHDGIGLTGCHYDNHAVDYEFESDEGLFWTWGCRGWRVGRTGGEIPLGSLIPADLDNVVIASRALGVTQDAHHSLRMQRDMQRIGEVAGIVAALARSVNGAIRSVPFAELRRRLIESGALAEAGDENDNGFGMRLERPLARATLAGGVTDWITALRGPESWVAMWRLAKTDGVADDLAALLTDADTTVTWRVAMVLAIRGDARAEPRLLAAIASQENGHADEPEDRRPERFNRVAYNWWTAVALLRCCGTAASVPVLASLIGVQPLPFHCATALALTCTRLAGRLPAQRQELAAIAERLALNPPTAGTIGDPQRNPTTYAPCHRPPGRTEAIVEDRAWQFHLVVAQALQACGRPVHPAAKVYGSDARLLVRRAFARLAPAAYAAKA